MMVSRRQAITSSVLLPILAGIGTTATGGKTAGQEGRSLVAYFTRTGNTQLIANIIARATGATLFRIVPAQPYPDDYEEQVAQATNERERGFEPPLQETVTDIARYQTVYLGFPVWGETTPAIVRSFLTQHDLTGKTLVPFITHGGYGPGSSEKVVTAHAQNARIEAAFIRQCDQERQTIDEVKEWLNNVYGMR
jgi:flavodoxin